MQEVILLKYGELILKGLNRPTFEARLMKNIRYRLAPLGPFTVTGSQSALCVSPQSDECDLDEAVARMQKIFGIISVSRACVVEKNFDVICRSAAEYLREVLSGAKTFKVEAKRSDKRFPLTSPEIASEAGAFLLEAFPNLKVDVRTPETVVVIEIRDFGAYIHAASLPGAGGMPAGTNGRAALLVSGGIDSPVAGYMMAKRGMELCAVHFASPPYTSERARLKVLDLLKIVSGYAGRIDCHIVPFTRIQEQIRANCPEEYFTLVMRRMMMKCASRIAQAENCSALITGESIGQVASQTIEAITCTQAAASFPVLRPLIGMDKEEIVQIARKIDTYETSILPYEDCCTVFTPRHPRTHPKLSFVEEAERACDFGPLLDEAVAATEKVAIRPSF